MTPTTRVARTAAVAIATTLLAASAAAAQQPSARPAAYGSVPQGATSFTIRVENVSTTRTLALSNGQTAPAPTAPVLWVVHTEGEPIFGAGAADRGEGLESLAEDGDPSALAGRLAGARGVGAAGAVAIPLGDSAAGPALPGKAFELTVTAEPGQRLSLAFMFGQSNDLFYAFDPAGIELFPGGRPLAGDVTQRLALWDAGTEVNEEPGLGASQAPRQARPNSGAAEHAPVQLVARRRDGFTYPGVSQVVRLTITPRPAVTSSR